MKLLTCECITWMFLVNDFYNTQNTMQMNEPVDAMNRCASDIAERLFFWFVLMDVTKQSIETTALKKHVALCYNLIYFVNLLHIKDKTRECTFNKPRSEATNPGLNV